MSAGRPAPVIAHLRRPLRWLLVLVPLLAVLLAFGVADQGDDEQRRDRAIPTDGTLVDRRAGDGRARVRYVHPVTGQELTLAVPVRDPGRLPASTGPVDLDADPGDPEGVRLRGDVASATGELGWDLPYLAVPVLVWGRRRWGVRRTERLMGGAGPSFVMLGAIAPPGWWGWHPELHLWPLDAAPGAPSLCQVGLVATSSLPVGGTVFTVEVKGRPRPFGRVVARSLETGGVLWPAGAALPGRARPRPSEVVVPAALAPEVEVGPEVRRVRPPGTALTAGAALVISGGLMLAAVTAVTLRNAGQARRVEEGPLVVAEVMGRDDRGDRVVVAYGPEGDRRTGRAPVEYVEDFTVGRRYPATVDPEDPSRLRLVKARYDTVPPIVSGALPLLAGLAVAGRFLRRWVLGARLARRGGWRPFEMAVGPQSTSWATLVIPTTDQAVCSVRFGVPGVDRPPEPAATALVAGDPQPGGPLVVHVDGRTQPAARVGIAPRLRWWRSSDP